MKLIINELFLMIALFAMSCNVSNAQSYPTFQPLTLEEMLAVPMLYHQEAQRQQNSFEQMADRFIEMITSGNYQGAIILGERCVEKATKSKFIDSDYQFFFYFWMGYSYECLRDYENAKKYYGYSYNGGKGYNPEQSLSAWRRVNDIINNQR